MRNTLAPHVLGTPETFQSQLEAVLINPALQKEYGVKGIVFLISFRIFTA